MVDEVQESVSQRKPEEKTTLEQVIRLADQLTPGEQEQLVEQIKLRWLQRAIDEADQSLERGEAVSLEKLDEHISSVRQEIVEDRQK
jgi:hypothetical protein